MYKLRRNASIQTAAREVVIAVSPGLGTALARRIHAQAMAFDAKVIIANQRGGFANARSLFALLSLGLCLGDPVSLTAEGPEASSACDTVAALFEEGDKELS